MHNDTDSIVTNYYAITRECLELVKKIHNKLAEIHNEQVNKYVYSSVNIDYLNNRNEIK